MSIKDELKLCSTIDTFYKILSSIDETLITSYSTEVDAIDAYIEILTEIPSLTCREDAEIIKQELVEIYQDLEDYSVKQVIVVQQKNIDEKIKNLRYCNKDLIVRISKLEQHAPICSKCGQSLVVRDSKSGYFWGCKDYPTCWGKSPFTKEETAFIYDGVKPSVPPPMIFEQEPLPPKEIEKTKDEKPDKESQYLNLIQKLEQSLNPFTDEEFAYDHICQNVQVVHALSYARKILEQEYKKLSRKKDKPSKAGTPWNTEADNKLLNMYKKGISIVEIAEIFERTQGAIRSRLLHFNVLGEEE